MAENFYVTTAIPYVNAKPHIGNAMDYMLGDTLARYHKSLGENVFFQVGTDEHGNKIALKAEEAGLEPQAYTDQMVPAFHVMLEALNVQYDAFIRTSNPEHKQVVQLIWQKLQPYIYKGTYEGLYCVGCEAFVTPKEAAANNGVCPIHNQPYQQLSEENYYLRLSEFSIQLKEAIETGTLDIQPIFRRHEILNLIEKGLEDISISRPKKHLSWGVPVPGDDSQVMYVWIDALANYITVLGYPDGENFKTFWPANVQIVGKDILRFHAAIWPAMLIGLGLPLPKQLLVHGFVNVGGTKMSKTIGNVVDPIEIVNSYGVDAFRYFFLRHIPTLDDGDFTWEKFEAAYNGELGNELGNLVQRIAAMITRYQQGAIGKITRAVHDANAYHEAMQQLRLNDAFGEVWNMVRQLNGYLEEVKPWKVAKENDEEHLQEILSYAAGSLTQIADLLAPFLPHTADAIKTCLGGETVQPIEGVLFPKIYQHTIDPRAPKVEPGQTPASQP
ncbi:MAG TPA: methionine--tRNA ligase [Candidatus Saccharimonadales bacterium]